MLLAVVLRPVGGEDPAVGIHSRERRGAGHGHDHAYGGDINSSLVEKVGGTAENADVVLVEAEHDAEVNGDSVAMQVRDERAILCDAVVRFVRGLKTFLRD